MNDCLIITTLAKEFAAEIERLSAGQITSTACETVDEARRAYAGEPVLFGSPGMIARVIDEMPGVDWVQSSWAGVTPLIESGRRDYVLTGVKGVFGPQMAEYTLGYLLAHTLKVHERQAAQTRREWYREHSDTLAGKTLGVLGTGSIGRDIARAAKVFGMTILGLSRSGEPKAPFDEVYDPGRLHEFLAGVDHLVSTLPATGDTHHLLDAAALACLRPHTVFVNVGRSNVVDDEALIAALGDERLAGAVLDVFDEEPLPEDSELWNVPGLTVTAHVAAISHPVLIVPIFVKNYALYKKGAPLRFTVDFSSGY